jgi:type IV pilus assembly protein PilC
MVRIAGDMGRMEEGLESLREYAEKKEALRVRVRTALMYPVGMLCVVLLVVAVLLTQAMPVFARVFEQLGFAMSGPAGALLGIGAALSRYGLWIGGGVLLLALCVLLLYLSGAGARISRRLFDSLPIARGLSARLSLQRFAMAMSAMLECGLDVSDALEMAGGLMGSERSARKVREMRERVRAGAPFQEALRESGLIEGRSMALLSMGLYTGAEGEIFRHVGEEAGDAADRGLERLTSAIEPVAAALMCFLVALMLLSVLLPMLSVLSGM